MLNKILPILRILLGAVFIVSAIEKLLGPYQNFMYVIENYQILPPALEEFSARVFPWLELIVGILLLLGLYIRQAAIGSLLFAILFMTIVSQAIIRQLPIGDCGCFGELISFPLHVVLIIDSTIFVCSYLFLKNNKSVSGFSLDQYFAKAS